MFFPRLPIRLTVMVALAPTSLAFPLAAAAVAVAVTPAVVSAWTSGAGIPSSDDVSSSGGAAGGVFQQKRRHRQWQWQHRARRRRRSEESFMLQPRERRPVSMALPSRRASVALFAAGMIFGSCISSPVSANFRLYRTVPDIPRSMFKDHASLKGMVITVSDGDSIRVRHAPNVPLPIPGRKMEGKKSEETLQIRLYAVDCPEIAHFGNPAQPFSAEAKAFTKEALQGKMVKIKLLSMDQYNRAVCRVQYGDWPFRKDITAELLKHGLGVVYRQGGAEYDGREEKLSRYENEAKSTKEGLWAQANGETPAQYKARMKRQQPAGAGR